MQGDSQHGEPRNRVELSHGWQFVKKKADRPWLSGAPSAAESIDLPHSWNETDTFQEGVRYYQGPGSYRRSFDLGADALECSDRTWLLESGGFYGTGDIWLNGARIARVDGQYLGFSVPVPGPMLRSDGNVIGIRLTNRCARDVLPGIRMPDFLLHGGLAARVGLTSVPAFRFEAGTLHARTTDVLSNAPRAELGFSLLNDSGRVRTGTVESEIHDSTGTCVARGCPIPVTLGPQGESMRLTVAVTVGSARLWSLDDRNLYEVQLRLLEDGRTVDIARCRFGFRHAEFVPDKGFFLNGERVQLRGCNRHESMPGFGNALPEAMHRHDAELLKEHGFNFVRLSHYPQHPVFLDACDELGILVYPEIASWKSVRTGRWLKNALRQMRAMVSRDRNHPSVILWGMGNESRSRRAYIELRRAVRDLDPDRPVTYAENHLYRAKREKTTDLVDVWGLNYEFDVLDDVSALGLLRNVLITECSNEPHTERGNLEAEARQVKTILTDLARVDGKACVAGYALWCFNDYATLRKERYLRYSGLFDAWRTPKMAAALMRAIGNAEPYIRVFGLWNPAPSGEACRIHVISNCARVAVRTAKGTRIEADVPFYSEHSVAYEPGNLEVVGLVNGEPAATDSLTGFAEATAIEVRHTGEHLAAASRETVAVAVRIVDDAGAVVRSWNGIVTATVEGCGRLRSYRADGGILIGAGAGRAFISGTGSPGEAVLRIAADGLRTGIARMLFR